MNLNKILYIISKGSSDSVSGKSQVAHTNSSKMTCHRKTRNRHDNKDDWANNSGFYRKLSDRQKQYVDKISDILDLEDDEW